MILVISPFHWYHTVTLNFDLLQGQICCGAGDHNSSNLLVFVLSNDLIYHPFILCLITLTWILIFEQNSHYFLKLIYY